MSSLNKKQTIQKVKVANHNGLIVNDNTSEKKLERLVLASMLFEKQFYLDGVAHADLVSSLVAKVSTDKVAALAVKARGAFKLRHIPLLLTRELAKTGRLTADALNKVIQRPDEMSEFLSLYWKDGKSPVSNQVKKGLANAFVKFNEYQLAKWDKNSAAVSLRDVMFLTHPKPTSVEQEALFKRVANQELVTPDTWETELSSGADKAATFTRLMAEKKLGALAFLRNLRNMVQSGVSETVIRRYAKTVNVDRVLPFRYIAAARIVPQFEDMLEAMMLRSLGDAPKLTGKTKLYLDVSSSTFDVKVSAKSDLTRQDAILALAMLAREVCEEVEIYSFSGRAMRIAPRHGFALAEAVKTSQRCTGTNIGASLSQFADSKADRIILITDEQSRDRVSGPKNYGADVGYIINVAAYQNGVNHGEWTTVTGFSEAIVDYIRESESN